VNSIIFVGLVTLAFALASLIGVGEQEAFQLLENAAGVFYAIAYMILFAIPIFGLKTLGVRTPMWLQLVAGCGFLVSLLYAVLTIVPIVEVGSRLSFAMKIIVVTAAANAIGAGIFAAGKRSKKG
jgi:amino acid transporter